MPSKVFGPTASAADTLTQIGSTYQMPPGDWEITDIRIGKGNVVNATICAGFVHVKTVERCYDFAYGNGSGGATNNGQNQPAEKIQCAIHVPGSSELKVYVLDVDVCADVTVSVHFVPGGPNNFRTYAGGGVSANADTAADTQENFSVSAKLLDATLTPIENASIRQIRFAGSGVVDAKAGSGILTINIPGDAGPHEFGVGSGPGGATLGGISPADVIDIPEGIPIQANSTMTVSIKTAETMKSPAVSLSCW